LEIDKNILKCSVFRIREPLRNWTIPTYKLPRNTLINYFSYDIAHSLTWLLNLQQQQWKFPFTFFFSIYKRSVDCHHHFWNNPSNLKSNFICHWENCPSFAHTTNISTLMLRLFHFFLLLSFHLFATKKIEAEAWKNIVFFFSRLCYLYHRSSMIFIFLFPLRRLQYNWTTFTKKVEGEDKKHFLFLKQKSFWDSFIWYSNRKMLHSNHTKRFELKWQWQRPQFSAALLTTSASYLDGMKYLCQKYIKFSFILML